MFRLVVIVSLLIAVYARVIPAPLPYTGGRIVGGEDAAIEDVPYQAALILYDMIICGGSIISANMVISAAHCVVDNGPSFRVRVGTNTNYQSTNDQGQIVGVRKVMIHPQYESREADYDVSLFFLSSPVTLGPKASPIRLPGQNQVIADNSPAVTSGWGNLREGSGTPLLLQKVTIPTVNQDVCESRYNMMGWSITPRMICAGLLDEGGKDACQGDSGGPLVAGGVLIGITSWGNGCARPGFPGVWSRVPAFSDWVKSQL